MTIYIYIKLYNMTNIIWAVYFLLIASAHAHVDWAIRNGAYLHPSLEYRDGGMYATSDIKADQILAIIPFRLEMRCERCLHNLTKCVCKEHELADLIYSYRYHGFWAPYIQSLDLSCHTPFCKPLNYSILTDTGGNLVDKVYGSQVDNVTSVVQSRSWLTGMRPLLDLFNHHHKAEPVSRSNKTKEYRLYTSFDIKKGEQAYNNYGKFDMFTIYKHYGYIPDQEPTCKDMLRLRVGDESARVSCVRTSASTIDDMFFEMVEAYRQGDLIMMKAAAQWLNLHIDYN